MTAIDLGHASVVTWTPGATGATVVLTVTLPDLTTATPSVTEATGVYSATVTTSQAGRYRLKWTIAASSKVYTDVLDVWPADPRFIVSLDEVVSAIRQTTTLNATDRSDMRLLIAAATPVIEDIVGAVLVTTQVQTSDGGVPGISLWKKPTSITSVVSSGTTLAAADYTADLNAGIVYAANYGYFASGRQTVVITYSVGSSTIQPNVRLATIELVRHWWQWGRQTHRAAIPGDSPATPMGLTPSGYAVPNRVLELLAASKRVSGFA